MNTKTVGVAHRQLPAPEVGHLLRPQTSTATKPANPWDLGPESVTVRAMTVSVVFEEIFEQKGHPHGGIND